MQDPIFVAPVVLRTGHAVFCSVAGVLCCFDIETDCQVITSYNFFSSVLRQSIHRLFLQMWRYVIGGNVFSYPVVESLESTDTELVIVASHNKNLYLLETSGKNVKSRNEPRLRSTLRLCSSIFATPWCDGRYIFVACTDGTLQTFNMEGELLASKRLPGETFSSPIVHDDLVVLGCRDNNLYVLRLG